MPAGVAIVVILAWLIVPAVAGAWRTRNRDAWDVAAGKCQPTNREKRAADAPAFTHADPPAAFNPPRRQSRRSPMAPARPQPVDLGNMDVGRLADFNQGVKESRDASARTALTMVGAYVGMKLLQRHWSAWRRETQGR
jgi:hypothetical protein